MRECSDFVAHPPDRRSRRPRDVRYDKRHGLEAHALIVVLAGSLRAGAGRAIGRGRRERDAAGSRAAPRPRRSWAAPQIAAVVAAGVMGPDVATFRPDDSLTRGELHDAIVALGRPHKAPPDPMRIVTMRELDAQLVAAAGLLPSARTIRLAARDAGLEPTDMLGTETVARLLGLRVNHPVGSESLERSPKEPASRAEAAYSLSKLLGLEPWRVTTIQQLTGEFTFPVLTDWQRAVLTRALRFVGYPYVFAGRSEKTQKLWSATSRDRQRSPCPAGSTARGSSGGSSSSSRSPARRSCPRC